MITKWVLEWLPQFAKGAGKSYLGHSHPPCLPLPALQILLPLHALLSRVLHEDGPQERGWVVSSLSAHLCFLLRPNPALCCAPKETAKQAAARASCTAASIQLGCPSECVAPGTLALACSAPLADYELRRAQPATTTVAPAFARLCIHRSDCLTCCQPVCADYELEAGATRNYEPWRDKEKQVAAAVANREEEERGNAMKVGCSAHRCCQGKVLPLQALRCCSCACTAGL